MSAYSCMKAANDIYDHKQNADCYRTGSRDPDHVLAEHARIHTSDENAAGIRAASIRESNKDSGCAAV